MVVERFGIYLVRLDPAQGAEMRKTRPAVVISPDELNRHLLTVIIAPLTSTIRPFPFRVDSTVAGRSGQIALDQMRAIDKGRLIKRIGTLTSRSARRTTAVLHQLFA